MRREFLCRTLSLHNQPVDYAEKYLTCCKQNLDHCKEDNVCFRHKSDSFRVPPFCPESEDFVNEGNEYFIRQQCEAVDLKIASQKCMSQRITSAKVIRLRSLERGDNTTGDNTSNGNGF